MNKIDVKIIDTISQYPIMLNDLLYGRKLDLYRVRRLLKYHCDKQIKLSLLNLLSSNVLYVTHKEFDGDANFLNQDFYCHHWLELTESGAMVWEQKLKPNWNYYISCSYDDKDYKNPVNIELISLNKNLLQEICKYLNQKKLQVELLDEWEICYWKTITDIPIFKYSYTAESIEEKILIDDIWQNLHTYKDKFCKKTRGFF